jgi:hypothetical protein
MSADEIHVGDVGTQFLITMHDGETVIDVSSAATKELRFKKPNGSVIVKNASFVLTGADGRIQYFTLPGDLDLDGYWKVQAHVVMPTGEWYSNSETFEVFANL